MPVGKPLANVRRARVAPAEDDIMETIDYLPSTATFLTPALPSPPLFLRTVAPATPHAATVYTFTLLRMPVAYAVHWLAQPDGTTERYHCRKDGCPWCADGHTAQEMYAAVVIDHTDNRFCILQMSRAAAAPVAQAATDYVQGRFADASKPVLPYGLLDPRQPMITLRAVRSGKGPRYSATATTREFTTDPSTGRHLGLARWFSTPPGADWLQDALLNTAAVLRPHVLQPQMLDLMRLIWPEEYPIEIAWEEPFDE